MDIRKLMIYRKNVTKPIELHDSSGIKTEEFEREIRKCFTAKDITIIETDDGVLTLRPSEITAILIREEKEVTEIPEKPASPDLKKIKDLKDKSGEEVKITDENIDGEKK